MAKNVDSADGRSRSTVKDDDNIPHKYFPNGLRSLIRSIHQYWPDDLDGAGKPQSWAAFLAKFSPYYLAIRKVYGLTPLVAEGNHTIAQKIKETLKPLETNSTKERREINFVDMRSFSEYVGGIPTGLFLILSQCMSENGQLYERRDQIAFIMNCIRSLEALKDFVESDVKENPDKEPFIVWRDKTAGIYDARLSALKKLVDEWNAGKLELGLREGRTIQLQEPG